MNSRIFQEEVGSERLRQASKGWEMRVDVQRVWSEVSRADGDRGQLRSREEADFVGVAKSRANLPRAAEMSFMLILGSQLRARGSIKRGTQAEA